MKLMSMFDDDTSYDLGLTLEDTYVLGYFYKLSNTSTDTKIIKNYECFSFNLVDLFKSRKRTFEQVKSDLTQEDIKKIYERNRKKLDRLLKGTLGRFVIKESSIKSKEGTKTYYRLNKQLIKILIDGYPTKEDRNLSEIELLVSKELNINRLGKSITKQLQQMDIEILKEAIECAKEIGILDYPYVKGIYNNLMENKKVASAANTNNSVKQLNTNSNDINSISDNNKNIKQNYNSHLNPKVHNFEGSANFLKYSPEELEKLLFENQKNKFK